MTGAADRSAPHGRTRHQRVPVARPARSTAKKAHQRVRRLGGRGAGAWLSHAARAVGFAGGNPRDPDPSALRAPYRPVAVPDPHGGAGERVPSGNDGGGEKEGGEHRRVPAAADRRWPARTARRPDACPPSIERAQVARRPVHRDCGGVVGSGPTDHVRAYEQQASRLAADYEAVDFGPFRSTFSDLLPSGSGRIALDVGAGSGRDAAWLSSLGYEVVAVEPAAAMREEACRRRPDAAARWLDDRLPALDRVHGLGLSFDLVLLSGVWQHVAPGDRARAFRKLATLLKPGGV